MNLTPRNIVLALGLAFTALAARAQHIELLTEANITFEITFGTDSTITTGSGATRVDNTTSITSRLSQANILEALREDGHITDESITGWSLKAVRAAPSDIFYVDSSYSLYAVKGDTRVRIPDEEFLTTALFSVENYVERHQGQNVLSAEGTTTNYAVVEYTPNFTRTLPPVVTTPEPNTRVSTVVSDKYVLSNFVSRGLATIGFVSKTDMPIFYISIEKLRMTSLGDFTGERTTKTIVSTGPITPRNSPTTDVETSTGPIISGGLVSVRITIDAAKLVPRSYYPEVSYND